MGFVQDEEVVVEEHPFSLGFRVCAHGILDNDAVIRNDDLGFFKLLPCLIVETIVVSGTCFGGANGRNLDLLPKLGDFSVRLSNQPAKFVLDAEFSLFNKWLTVVWHDIIHCHEAGISLTSD